MKPSKRNLRNAEMKREDDTRRLRGGPPAISKYAAKYLPVPKDGKP